MEEATSKTSLRRWVCHLPVVLLLGVWALQVALTQTHGLTPWKGGGFGMFSVVSQRTLEVSAADATGRRLRLDHLSLQRLEPRLYSRALAMPTPEILCHLASVITSHPMQVVTLENSALVSESRYAWLRLHEDPARATRLEAARRDEPVVTLRDIRRDGPPTSPPFEATHLQMAV